MAYMCCALTTTRTKLWFSSTLCVDRLPKAPVLSISDMRYAARSHPSCQRLEVLGHRAEGADRPPLSGKGHTLRSHACARPSRSTASQVTGDGHQPHAQPISIGVRAL